MAMREITVPELILVPPMSGEGEATPHTFEGFICKGLLTDVRFGGGYEMITTMVEIGSAFKKCKPGDKVRLRAAAWDWLVKVIDKPQFVGGGGFHPWSAQFLLPYFDAVRDAIKIE